MEEIILTPIEARQMEVDQYTANIALYETILAELPTEWPARLLKFKDRLDHQQTVSECSEEDVELLSSLLYMEQVKRSIRAEKLERTKAAAILSALKA